MKEFDSNNDAIVSKTLEQLNRYRSKLKDLKFNPEEGNFDYLSNIGDKVDKILAEVNKLITIKRLPKSSKSQEIQSHRFEKHVFEDLLAKMGQLPINVSKQETKIRNVLDTYE